MISFIFRKYFIITTVLNVSLHLCLSTTLLAQLSFRQDRIDPAMSIIDSDDENPTEVAIRDDAIALALGFPLGDTAQLIAFGETLTKNLSLKNLPALTTLDYIQLEDADYPTKLYQNTWGGGFLIPVGGDALILTAGRVQATDKKDLSDDDMVEIAEVAYLTDISGESSWVLGAAQTTVFGNIDVVPILGYRFSNDNTHINIHLPLKLSVVQSFDNGIALIWRESVEGGIFRLTEEPPWNNSMLSFSNIKSTLGLGIVVSSSMLLYVSQGITSHRTWVFRDSEGRQFGELRLEDSQITRISLELFPGF